MRKIKTYQIASDKKTEEIFAYLQGTKAGLKMRKALGVNSSTMSTWKSKREFPKYCEVFIRFWKLKNKID